MALDQAKLDTLKMDKSSRYERKSSGVGKWIGIIIILAALLAGAYFFIGQQQAEQLPVVETHTVVKPKADALPASDAILNASGYVVARRQATVSSKVTAKILEVMVEEGMQVSKGQVLAKLDDSTLKAQIALAESQLRAAQLALKETQVRQDEAQRSLERNQELRHQKLISEAVVDAAQSEVSALKARLSKARSDISVSQKNLALQKQLQTDYTIHAPFSGVVITKNAQPGEMISPAATGGSTRTGICTIVDMSSREIEVDVNEAFINKVNAGQEVEAILDAYPEWVIPAKVINIVPTADRQKATVKVRIGFDELDDRVLTDMGVRVTFLSDESERDINQSVLAEPVKIRVPLNTIYTEDSIDKVLVVDEQGLLSKQTVQIEKRTLSNAIVQSGLNGGERLVIDPESVKNLRQISIK